MGAVRSEKNITATSSTRTAVSGTLYNKYSVGGYVAGWGLRRYLLKEQAVSQHMTPTIRSFGPAAMMQSDSEDDRHSSPTSGRVITFLLADIGEGIAEVEL